MDAIRLDVIGEEHGVRAVLLQRLLGLIRCRTKQWWINRSLEGLIGTTRAAFHINANGSPVTLPMPCASVTELLGGERCLDAQQWADIGATLLAGEAASFAADLLMDARLHAARGEHGRAVLDAAIACEYQAVATIRAFVEERGAFREGRDLRGKGLPAYISSDLLRVTGRRYSYKVEDATHFQHIEQLWKARGSVAHGGPAVYRAGGHLHAVTDKNLAPMILAAERLVAWLVDIAPPN